MERLEDLAWRIEELAACGKYDPVFLGPVPESRVQAAEEELGVKFVGSYRAFLLHLGGAKMLGYDFDGLPENPQSPDQIYYYISTIDNTKGYRSFMDYFPPSYVSITDDGGEITYWIDTAKIVDDESPIIGHL